MDRSRLKIPLKNWLTRVVCFLDKAGSLFPDETSRTLVHFVHFVKKLTSIVSSWFLAHSC